MPKELHCPGVAFAGRWLADQHSLDHGQSWRDCDSWLGLGVLILFHMHVWLAREYLQASPQ